MQRPRLELSRADVVYLLVGLLTFAVAVYTQANLMFWLCGILAGGLLAAWVLPGAMLRRLEIERVLPAQATAGEDAVFRYRLRNGKRWLAAIDVTVAEWPHAPASAGRGGVVSTWRAAPQAWALYVGPKQELTIAAWACPTRRGELGLEGVWLSSGFPFGIFRRRRRVALAQRLVVYPPRYRLRPGLVQRLVRHESVGRVPMRRGGGVDEFYGLREYRAGDSWKMIHWKHSARGRGWRSREMTMLAPPHVLVRLDLRQEVITAGASDDGRQGVEEAISLAASVVQEACQAGFRVGLQIAGVAGASQPVAAGRGHLERMLRALALIDLAAADEPAAPMAAPSIIIRPGRGGQTPGGRVAVWGAAELQTYLLPSSWEGRVAS